MGQGALNYQGVKSGIKLNDVIEDFKYVYRGQTIEAGDLVNYINGLAGKVDLGESVDTQLSTETNTGYTISAVALDNNRVFIAHSYGSSYYLYGVIVTIDGASITYGADTKIDETSRSGYAISACLLPNGNVFIAHSSSGSYYLYGIVVSIDGTTITKGNDTSIVGASYTGYTISTCLLPNGNVFIAHSHTSTNYRLAAIVCTISGTTITKGNDTSINITTNYTGSTISTCLLPNGNVFIAHSYGSTAYLYGIVCSISGTTITSGSDTAISTESYTGSHISTCLLSNGNVFIAHSYGSDSYLYGIVISINGTAITKGTDVNLGDGRYFTGYAISTCLLPNGDVFIAHNWDRYDYYLYGMIVSIDGTTITKKTDIALSDTTFQGQVISALLLPNGTIFIAHSNTEDKYYLYAQIFGIDYENNVPTNNIVITEYEQQVTPAIEPPFDAIALSSGVGAPEFVEGEVTKTGNIFEKTWTKVSDTEYVAEDGTKITTNATVPNTNSYYLAKGFDGTRNSFARLNLIYHIYITIELPNPTKITKMKTIFGADTQYFNETYIQGSNDGSNWSTLKTFTGYSESYASGSEPITEHILNKPDYYKYYRLYAHAVALLDTAKTVQLYEWQVSEYVEIEQIPSTEHNEQVKIARVYKEIQRTELVQGDIIPKTWTKVSDLEYVAEGIKLTAGSVRGDSVYRACDGSADTEYQSQKSEYDREEHIQWEFDIPQKITKMYFDTRTSNYLSTDYVSLKVQASNDNSTWNDLFIIPLSSSSSNYAKEMTLSNIDYYKYYRIFGTITENWLAVYEWYVTEYETTVTEVIQ